MQSLRNVFVVHRNVSGAYQALATCYPIPMALVISSTVGTLLLIGIGLLVAVVVIVNINDLRRWQRFQAEKLENEMRLAEHSNPLFKDKPDSSTTIQNPAFGSG